MKMIDRQQWEKNDMLKNTATMGWRKCNPITSAHSSLHNAGTTNIQLPFILIYNLIEPQLEREEKPSLFGSMLSKQHGYYNSLFSQLGPRCMCLCVCVCVRAYVCVSDVFSLRSVIPEASAGRGVW
ncbi:unnamed protein product [Arctogadus glacialis]